MNAQDFEPQERIRARMNTLDNDRFAVDRIDTCSESAPVLDEYRARVERQRKHAALRTEMMQRARNNGYSSYRPDGTF